jgi:hypothetical protein
MKRNNPWIVLCAAALVSWALLPGCATLPADTGSGTQQSAPARTEPAAGSTAATPAPAKAEAAAASGVTGEDPFAGAENLALGRSVRSNNHIYDFTATKAVDGDLLTYFEGAANAYPNELTVDLGAMRRIRALRIKLNPRRIWQKRAQTIEVLVSADGAAFTTALKAAEYEFDPVSGENTVTIPCEAEARYVRLSFKANTGATGGQAAELEIFGE